MTSPADLLQWFLGARVVLAATAAKFARRLKRAVKGPLA